MFFSVHFLCKYLPTPCFCCHFLMYILQFVFCLFCVFLIFTCLVFLKHVWPQLCTPELTFICPHRDWMESTNRSFTVHLLPNTCALMHTSQCYFSEWCGFFFYFSVVGRCFHFVFGMTLLRKHIEQFQLNKYKLMPEKSTSLVKRESVYLNGIHTVFVHTEVQCIII